MAAIMIILGSVLGFATALVGWIALDFSLLTGLAIWIGAGPVAALLAVALSGTGRQASANAADQVMAEA